MKILIISPGKGHDHMVADGVAEYQKRMGKKFALEWAFPPAGTKDAEGTAILKLIKKDDFVVLLDERGVTVESKAFSNIIKHHLESGTKRMVFVIGGAFGVNEAVRQRAPMMVAFSALVFPHMLVRLLLIEQIYRAATIIDGGKYHHG